MILKSVYKAQECDELFNICNSKISLKDSINIQQNGIITNQKKVINNQVLIIQTKDNEIDNLKIY
ncbi:MAG: hypothetical protein ACFFKA_19855, partial [Candidatus Thorarchaeota archaeon]